MKEGLRMLGSLARFVTEKEPELADKLTPLVMSWAIRENISMEEMLEALNPAVADQPAESP